MLGTVNLMYQKRGDCLVDWAYGGVYPRDDQQPYVAEFKRTGDLLGPVIDFGHVAVSGMCRYRNDQMGRARGALFFVTQFNTHKVVAVEIEPQGSTYEGQVRDFWVSSNPDCHPTDVLEDADGSLLVIDTGGWFRNGCPTSQVAKPDVLGAIYRIRAPAPLADARGLNIDWSSAKPSFLTHLFGDPRPAVRDRAVDEIARRGNEGVAALERLLKTTGEPQARQSAIWAFTRIDTPPARLLIRALLPAADAAVAQTAIASVGSTRDAEALPQLTRLVVNDNVALRRHAATALGRLRQAEAVPALLDAAQLNNDRLAEHAIIYALIEIDDRTATLAGLDSASPQSRRAALIALDQMDHGDLRRDLVGPLLNTDDVPLQKAAIDVIARRGWTDEFVRYCRDWLRSETPDPEQASIVQGALSVFLEDAQVQALIGEALAAPLAPTARRLLVETIQRGDLTALPQSWNAGITNLLADADPAVQRDALSLAGRYPEPFADAVDKLAHGPNVPADLRWLAVCALARAGQSLSQSDWSLLVAQLTSAEAPLDRLRVADALGLANLSEPQLIELCGVVEQLGPLELPPVLRAYEAVTSQTVGDRLIAALKISPGASALSLGAVRGFSQPLRGELESLLAAVGAAQALSSDDLRRLEEQTSGGDPIRGRLVFFGAKAACFACHTVAGAGGQVGPDLTKIGGIRNQRDLLESIALPSQTLARGFETYDVETSDGHILQGVLHRETAEHIWLRLADRSERRVPRSDVTVMAPSKQSIMPEGLLKKLALQEQADLLAYLLSLK